MALNILNTNGSNVARTGAEFEAYDVIRYSATSPLARVTLSVSDSSTADLVDELGSVSADVSGSDSANAITTGGGNDTIFGRAGADTLSGGAGDDLIDGGDGNDALFGGEGSDQLFGRLGDDTIRGGAGDDTIEDGFYYSVNPEVFDVDAGVGNDTVILSNSIHPSVSGTIDGGDGADTLRASFLTGLTIKNFEVLESGELGVTGSAAQFDNIDKIVAQSDSDIVLRLSSSAHADLSGKLGTSGVQIYAAVTSINVTTDAGNDRLEGTDGSDVFDARAGDDVLNGYGGDDALSGGEGNDQINGGFGKDVIKGGAGDDSIFDGETFGVYPEVLDIDAGEGNDAIIVQTANGVLSGAIDGGTGIDILRAPTLTGLTVKNVEIFETYGYVIAGSSAQFESFDKIVFANNSTDNYPVLLSLTDSAHLDLSDELGDLGAVVGGDVSGIDVKTGGGDDEFTSTRGDDIFDGGAGLDMAVFSGDFASYSFAIDNGSHVLTSALEGKDTLIDVESARFADGVYDFATETFTPANKAPTNIQLSKTAVSEDTPIWTTVGLLSARDADGDALTYTLLDAADDHFRINGNRIVTSKALDYETTTSHTIRVAVSDGKVTVQKDITINVLDVNEAPLNQAPTNLAFSRSSVSENIAIGTSVGLLSARDPEGGTVKWRLTDDADGIFKLVGNKIQTKAAIDYESTHSLTFTAEAYDAAGNVTSYDFTLAVKDVFESSVSSLSHEALI
ncbi:calcium-binding protein [Rhizobium leguminosarum]|uniref:Calcium-binding protein n=1 Tax=Rhizobium leguminosarum TaxID=384 RepID=A0A4Q1TZ83_RHILE|nr:cadherin domain-containing protein [Rhizobium leguminosarum]RXT24143.1 calcium-binding protein [Rhizobium leguminosarum]